MIEWSDQERLKDYGCFCREASKLGTSKILTGSLFLYNFVSISVTKPICVVSDVRRKNDIKWFKENFGERIKTVRVHCNDQERIQRGWNFQTGVDDVQSECDLDDYTEWNFNIDNSSGRESYENLLRDISQLTL